MFAGSDAVFVAAGIASLNYVLMGKPGVKTAEQLKGGTVAISRFGSATDTIARFALRKIGLNPGKDITLVQVGSGPDRLSAALTGRVTASVINPPSSFIAEKKGLAIIADVPKWVWSFNTPAQQQRGSTSRNIRIRCAATFERTWKRCTKCGPIKRRPSKALGHYMGSGLDRETLEKSYENVMTEAMYPKKQYPSLEGLKTVLDDIAERDPRVKSAKPEQFVDMTFIRELDQSGFIDGLYKKK